MLRSASQRPPHRFLIPQTQKARWEAESGLPHRRSILAPLLHAGTKQSAWRTCRHDSGIPGCYHLSKPSSKILKVRIMFSSDMTETFFNLKHSTKLKTKFLFSFCLFLSPLSLCVSYIYINIYIHFYVCM